MKRLVVTNHKFLALTVLSTLACQGPAADPAAAQDSCSLRRSLCDQACDRRIGDAKARCTVYCRTQYASCLKTGVFVTVGGTYTGLQRK